MLYDSAFWKRTIDFAHLAEEGLCAKFDLDLFDFADTPQEAWNKLLQRGLELPEQAS